MGYKAKHAGSGHVRKSGRRRILLLADFAYASGKAVASGVIRHVSLLTGVELLVQGHTSEMPTVEEGMIPISGIDGIVSCFGSDMGFMRAVLDAAPRVPVVFASVGRHVAPLKDRRVAAIFCDHAAVAEAAAELLVRHGLAEFGYVGSRHALAARSWDAERGDAFGAAIARRGFHAETYSPKAGLPPDEEHAALAAWLRALPKPCGVFVSDDMRAMHVLNVCRVSGLAVPEQIQVVGADNEEWICAHTSPTLTSVEPDFEGCCNGSEIVKRVWDAETEKTERVESQRGMGSPHPPFSFPKHPWKMRGMLADYSRTDAGTGFETTPVSRSRRMPAPM